jgi:hypothetical protein
MIIEPNENHRKYLPIAGMILFFIVGFFVAYFWMNAKVQKTFKDCAANPAEKKAESTIPAVPKMQLPSEIFSVGGKVENIDGQKITIKSLSLGEEKTYQVTAGSETKIIKREMDLSPPKAGTEKTLSEPKETEASLSDIKIGDSLTVDSADNIKDKTEFTAKSIYLEITIGLPTPPAMPDANSIPAPPAMPQGDKAIPPMPAAQSSSEALPAPSAPK